MRLSAALSLAFFFVSFVSEILSFTIVLLLERPEVELILYGHASKDIMTVVLRHA